MKRLLLFLFFASLIIAQGVHKTYQIQTPEGGTTFWCKRDVSDTSRAFVTWPTMTLEAVGYDTSGQDSVHADIIFQMDSDTGITSSTTAEWTTVKHCTITSGSDSTKFTFKLTETAIENFKHGRIIVDPLGDNIHKSYGAYEIILDGYIESRR